jgi:hypothetical protein
VPFDETVENAWENQQYHSEDHRRQVNPMPPLFSITIGQPEWVQQAPNTKVTDFNSNSNSNSNNNSNGDGDGNNDDDNCDDSSSSSNGTEVRVICCKFIYLQVFIYLICT